MASARLLCVVRQDFYQQVHGVLRRNLLRKQQVSILLTFQVVFIHENTILFTDSLIVNIAKSHWSELLVHSLCQVGAPELSYMNSLAKPK